MKCILVLCLFSLVALSVAAPDGIPTIYPTSDRGCFRVLGNCVKECPVGTHEYSIGCGKKVPEATCEHPHPVQEQFEMCDFSDCYCDPPNVRNTDTKQCVPLDQCPKKE